MKATNIYLSSNEYYNLLLLVNAQSVTEKDWNVTKIYLEVHYNILL